MFLLCLLVLIFTIVNIVLMEIVEWDYLEVKKAADASDDDLRKSENSLIFLSKSSHKRALLSLHQNLFNFDIHFVDSIITK